MEKMRKRFIQVPEEIIERLKSVWESWRSMLPQASKYLILTTPFLFSRQNREKTSMALLPEEIIEEILYKLPPKSLLRFKSVCKSWDSCISSPQFIKTHLSKSTEIFANQNLILNIHRPPLSCLRTCSLQSFLEPDDVVSPTTILDYSVQNTSDDTPLRIHGSCNGLILLTTNHYGSLFLWNPSIRKARSIPYLHGHPFRSEKLVYGFGYNESADDYRIVCIYATPLAYVTYIYSLRNDSWKKIENFYDGASPMNDSGTFVNGRLHWIAEYDHYIVSLDLGKEEEEERVYEVVAKPRRSLSESLVYPQCLRVLGGNLGLVCFDNRDYCINVWVMKDYGVRESWVQILIIWNTWSRFSEPERVMVPFLTSLMGLRQETQNGDGVLAFGSSTLIFYDGQYNLHDIQTDVVSESFEAIVYLESLVSPFGKGGQPPNLATTDLLQCWLNT